MKLLAVKKSDKPKKKFMAIFGSSDKKQKVYFGAAGMDDYTLKKDKDQRERYRKRHAKEKDQEANTPGALAYHILWGDSTSRTENVKSFKEKYNV